MYLKYSLLFLLIFYSGTTTFAQKALLLKSLKTEIRQDDKNATQSFLNRPKFKRLKNQILYMASVAKGTVGIAIRDLATGDTLFLNKNERFPMQSVFKFPLAMYVLHLVDQKKLTLEQQVHLSKEDLSIPYASPLRDKYPEGDVFAIVLYIRDSTADQQTRENVMASITRLVYDSYK